MSTRRRSSGVLVAVSAVVVTIGACTSLTATPTPSRTVSAEPTAQVAADSSIPTHEMSSSTPSASATPCDGRDLSITAVDSAGGLGAVNGSLRFQNRATSTCTLSGFPLLIGVTAAGVKTTATHWTAVGGPGDYPPIEGTPTVVLAPGDAAFAGYEGGDNPHGPSSSCPPAYVSLEVTAPGTTSSVSVSAFNYWLDQNLPACDGIAVSPVVAASVVPWESASLRP